MDRSNERDSIVQSDFFLSDIDKRLMIFEGHHGVSNCWMVSSPFRKSVEVSPKRRWVDVSNVIRDNKGIITNLLKEFHHLLIELHHQW